MTIQQGWVHCVIHDEVEKVTEESTVCFECRHSYPNADAIKEAFLEVHDQTEGQILPNSIVLLKGDTVDDIGFCPLCLHDW